MPRRRNKHYRPHKRDDYRIIVTGAPRPDIDVDALAQVIVRLAQKLAADQAAGGASSAASKKGKL